MVVVIQLANSTSGNPHTFLLIWRKVKVLLAYPNTTLSMVWESDLVAIMSMTQFVRKGHFCLFYVYPFEAESHNSPKVETTMMMTTFSIIVAAAKTL